MLFYLQRIDGKHLHETCPKYLVEPRPLNDGVQNTSQPPDFQIVIADFGAGMFQLLAKHNFTRD